MKTSILSLFFILTFSAGFAQSSDDALFYSIDTRSWATEEERNAHEAELEVAMMNDLNKIANADSGKLAECEAVKSRLKLDFRTIRAVRNLDRELKNIMTPKVLDVLQTNGITFESAEVGSELFCLPELADYANIYMDDYWRCRQWMEPKQREEASISPLDPDFVRYTFSQLSKAYVYRNILVAQVDLLVDALDSNASQLDSISTSAINLRSDELSNLTNKGYSLYSLDGYECKTLRERYERTISLYQASEKKLVKMDRNGFVDKEVINQLRDLSIALFGQVMTIEELMDWYSSFGDYDDLSRVVASMYPELGFGLYQSKNKETFYIQEMVNAYDCLLDLYNLSNRIMAEIEVAEKDATGYGSINVDLDKQINDEGKNIKTLFDEYIEMKDKMDTKFESIK